MANARLIIPSMCEEAFELGHFRHSGCKISILEIPVLIASTNIASVRRPRHGTDKSALASPRWHEMRNASCPLPLAFISSMIFSSFLSFIRKTLLGQPETHTPQSIHFPAISTPLPEMRIAPIGHMSAHMEQPDLGVRKGAHKDTSICIL